MSDWTADEPAAEFWEPVWKASGACKIPEPPAAARSRLVGGISPARAWAERKIFNFKGGWVQFLQF